jgi:nitrate ABC transporter ATP-binding subunit
MGYLVLQDVSKSFGAHHVLEGVNLEVARGEIVALIGHSGCGKSTLLNLVAGLDRSTSGTVLLEGRPILGPGPDRAVVFQNYALLPWLTVYENVHVVVSSVHRTLPLPERAQLVEHFLRLVGLWKHRSKRPGQISGGMKQRVALARALVSNPKVLLLDEPFAALDALTRAMLQDELLRLWEAATMDRWVRSRFGAEHKTVLLVTHDIDEAIYLADRIVVMTPGPAATIRRTVPVPLARPRERRRIPESRASVEIKEELLDLLTVVEGREVA